MNSEKTHTQVPAVVVGGTLNSLGVVRSLSAGGMPIYVLETSRWCAAALSRFCKFVRTSSREGDGLITALTELAMRLNCRPVLILTTDQSVDTVSDRRAQIEALYRIHLPSSEMVHALSEKTLFHALAERESFAVPRSVAVHCIADLDRFHELVPPIILKPADKKLVVKGIAARAVRAETIQKARTAATAMLRTAPRLIAQEWIDGPDTEILFTLFSCDGEGRIVGIFPGRKLVCWPPAIGNTAVCVAAPEAADELYAQTRLFVARTNYRGLGSLEFKRDSRTGRYLIVEPTVGRTDWQEEIATVCGVNLPLLTYETALGYTMPERNNTFELATWRSSLRHRPPTEFLTRESRMVDGFFRWSDPVPALYHYGYEKLACRFWQAASRRLTARSPRTTSTEN